MPILKDQDNVIDLYVADSTFCTFVPQLNALEEKSKSVSISKCLIFFICSRPFLNYHHYDW